MFIIPRLTTYRVEQRFAAGLNRLPLVEEPHKQTTIGAYVTINHRCFSWIWF